MQVVKQYLESTQTEGERLMAGGECAFLMGWGEFQRVMDIYMKQIDDKQGAGMASRAQADVE